MKNIGQTNLQSSIVIEKYDKIYNYSGEFDNHY